MIIWQFCPLRGPFGRKRWKPERFTYSSLGLGRLSSASRGHLGPRGTAISATGSSARPVLPCWTEAAGLPPTGLRMLRPTGVRAVRALLPSGYQGELRGNRQSGVGGGGGWEWGEGVGKWPRSPALGREAIARWESCTAGSPLRLLC